MQISVELTLSPAEAVDDALVRTMVRNRLTDVTDDSIVEMVIRRRSVDARSRVPVVNLRIDVYIDEPVPA
ncbi:MAG: FAD-binding protein, partial [Candidatus Kapaibacterium sp.]